MSSSKEQGTDRRMGLNDSDVFGDEGQAWGMEKDLDWRLLRGTPNGGRRAFSLQAS